MGLISRVSSRTYRNMTEPTTQKQAPPTTLTPEQIPSLSHFNGTYSIKNPDTSNFDKYCACLGVPWIARYIGRNIEQNIRFTAISDTKFEIETASFIWKSKDTFELEKQTEYKTMDKRRAFATWNLTEVNKLKMNEFWYDTHEHPGSKNYKCRSEQVWRIMKNGELRLMLNCKDEAFAERVYEKW